MLLREVEYARPATLDEAVALLAEHEGAHALAGGQTIVNILKARAASLDVLVDLSGLEELREISFSDEGALELGAMVTASELLTDSRVDVHRPILAEVAATIADVQVRNRGTVGGNVCVNDPTNHLPPLLVALDASYTIVGRAGTRTVGADEFFVGVYSTAVEEGELLTTISIPAANGAGDGFAAIPLGKHGTNIVAAAATIGGGRPPRVVIGCVDAVPVRASGVEERLGAGPFDAASVSAAAAGLGATLDPPDDVHASADYRRHLAEVCAARAILQAAERAKG